MPKWGYALAADVWGDIIGRQERGRRLDAERNLLAEQNKCVHAYTLMPHMGERVCARCGHNLDRDPYAGNAWAEAGYP